MAGLDDAAPAQGRGPAVATVPMGALERGRAAHVRPADPGNRDRTVPWRGAPLRMPARARAISVGTIAYERPTPIRRIDGCGRTSDVRQPAVDQRVSRPHAARRNRVASHLGNTHGYRV